MRISRLLQWFGAALAAIMMLAAGSPSHAQSSVRIEIYKAGFIVGVSGGRGTLVHAGKRYRLNIGGVSIGATIGASKAEFVGTAHNVRHPSDIEGTYAAAETGLAVVSGRKVARLRNAKGVVLTLRGRQVGLEFSADLSGMQVSLR